MKNLLWNVVESVTSLMKLFRFMRRVSFDVEKYFGSLESEKERTYERFLTRLADLYTYRCSSYYS